MRRQLHSIDNESHIRVFARLEQVEEVAGDVLEVFHFSQRIEVDADGGVANGRAAEVSTVAHTKREPAHAEEESPLLATGAPSTAFSNLAQCYGRQ